MSSGGLEYCPKTGKLIYENRAAANGALKRIGRLHKGQGLHPYKCRGHNSCGGYHLGRVFRRAAAAWRS